MRKRSEHEHRHPAREVLQRLKQDEICAAVREKGDDGEDCVADDKPGKREQDDKHPAETVAPRTGEKSKHDGRNGLENDKNENCIVGKEK
jgi:hypothetical protein